MKPGIKKPRVTKVYARKLFDSVYGDQGDLLAHLLGGEKAEFFDTGCNEVEFINNLHKENPALAQAWQMVLSTNDDIHRMFKELGIHD